MKKQTKFLSVLLFLTFAIGCCYVNQALRLADLLFKSFEAPEQVSVGAYADVVGDIINEAGTNKKDCELDVAGVNDLLLALYKVIDPDNQSTWILQDSTSLRMQPLEPNQHANLSSQFTIPDANTYAYFGFVDAGYEVEERNEDNNTDFAGKKEIPLMERLSNGQNNGAICLVKGVLKDNTPISSPNTKAKIIKAQLSY